MTRAFLYGRLADPDILPVLLGRAFASDTSACAPATLDGYSLPDNADTPFPLARPEAGARLQGVLVQGVPDNTLARIKVFHAGIGAQEQCLDVSGQPALAFFADAAQPAPDALPAESDSSDHWKEIARYATEEAMQRAAHEDGAVLRSRMPMILARAAARVAAGPGKPARVRSGLSRDRVEVTGQNTPHSGFFVTRQVALRHPLFGGGMSDQMTREVFVATDAAIVLPYDTARDRVLLVEQFRMGPFGRGDARPWMLEPVAGRIDAGETPEQAARRECEEEAGLTLSGLERISSHYCSPGCSTEYFHLFLGICDLPDMASGTGGLDSEHEDIRTHTLPFDQAMALLATGEADNGPLILSLIWLRRERARLRAAA